MCISNEIYSKYLSEAMKKLHKQHQILSIYHLNIWSRNFGYSANLPKVVKHLDRLYEVKIMRNFLKLGVLALTIFPLGQNLYAQSAQNDFDADGKSDYTIVGIGSDKSLNWSTILSGTHAENSLGTVGKSGDHIILAQWKGTGKAQIGAVGLSSNEKDLVWTIKNDAGGTEERDFGKSNFTALAGGDFDGNGKADAAIAVLKAKQVQWQISFDMFDKLVGQPSISVVNFGSSGDRIFFASPDGVNDWLGTIGKGINGKGVLLRLKNLKTGEVQSSTKFPKYIVNDSRPRPFPVKQTDNKDLLGFARVLKSVTTVDIRTMDGAQIAETNLPGDGDVVVGNFNDEPGEEVAIKTKAGYTVFNPVSKQTSEVTTSDGIAVDEININTFAKATSGGGNSGENNGGGDSPPPVSGAGCSNIQSWPGSHIYKTVGSHHFTDVRRNTSGIVVEAGGHGPFPGCVNIVDTKGHVLAKMGSYPPGPGWAARFYAGIGCGSGTPYNGATVASKARSYTGSQYIYADFGSVCYGPIDATKCLGSSSC
jgi:hypothetical protein